MFTSSQTAQTSSTLIGSVGPETVAVAALNPLGLRGHTAKADEALSLLSFHRHASLRIKGYTQAREGPAAC